MRIRRSWLLGSLGLVAVLTAACTPAPTGPDTAPPMLEVPERTAFVVGSQITTDAGDEDNAGMSTGIQALLTWSASDPSGICGYDVEEVFAGADPNALVQGTLETSYTYLTDTDYDDQFGGGSFKTYGFNVVARDCAGNSSKKFVPTSPEVIQEDGRTFYYGDRPPTYTGSWGTSSCTCWSNGAVRRTTEAGASMSFTVDAFTRRVALVMEQAPDRGRFRVLVNGAERAIVDNGTVSTPTHRMIVWEGAVEPNDVVQVVNLATAGRPRIDVDAIIVR